MMGTVDSTTTNFQDNEDECVNQTVVVNLLQQNLVKMILFL